MQSQQFLTEDERSEISQLINAFENHGCGLGLDLRAQKALQRLLDALRLAERSADNYRAMTQDPPRSA